MADDKPQSYALGRLILDYIRTFMWPAVIVVVVLVYEEDVRKILSEREVDIFGLRIGEKVEEIESRALAEIGDVRALLEEQQARGGNGGEIAADIETKLATLENNISREIAQVQNVQQRAQQVAPPPPPSAMPAPEPAGRAARAAAAERAGFEALLARDAAAALAAFDEAYEIWPEYHNVAEIRRLLQEGQERLAAADSEDWPRIYRKVLTRFSWGLPADLRPAFRQATAAAY